MIKWIGQHIVDFIARFRSDVYLEDIADGTVVDNKFLGLDSSNKIVKEAASATVTDLHSAGVDGAANQLLTDDGDGTITSEANLTFDGSTLSIEADSNTTANALFIDSNSMVGNSALMKFDFDIVGAVNNDYQRGIYMDIDKSGNVASGENNYTYGTHITFNDNGTNVGNSHFTGHQVSVTDANADGTNLRTGFRCDVSGGDATSNSKGFYSNVIDCGTDFYARSSANQYDYADWKTGTNGATTLKTTNGSGSSAAHFEIEADGNITLDAAGDIALETANGLFSCDAASVNFNGATSGRPSFNLINNANDASGPTLSLKNMRDGNGLEDADVLGSIEFTGEDAAGAHETYATIVGSVAEADNADEAGQIAISVANDGTLRNGITMTGDKGTAEEVDVTIANGAASTTTIAGDATVTSELTTSSIRHSISGDNDGDYGPGAEIIYSIGTTNVTAGVIYALKDSSSGAEWVQVDADIEASVHGLLAVATAAADTANSSAAGMIIKGCVTLANAYTAGSDDLGAIVYASQTGGEATLTKPTAADKFVRILGYSLNVSDGTNQKMFFNPDSTYIKLS